MCTTECENEEDIYDNAKMTIKAVTSTFIGMHIHIDSGDPKLLSIVQTRNDMMK